MDIHDFLYMFLGLYVSIHTTIYIKIKKTLDFEGIYGMPIRLEVVIHLGTMFSFIFYHLHLSVISFFK